MIKLSVILLTYNQEATVGRAIESVLAQRTRYPFEIVVAEDCSPDGTRTVCEEYERRYPGKVRLLPKVPNKGIVDNYFDAFEACQGEYVADCAGDDEWVDTSRIERCVAKLDADRSLSVVFTDVEECCDGECRLHSSDPLRRLWMRERISGQEMLVGVLNHTRALPYTLSAAIFRKSAVMGVYADNPAMVRIPECGVEDVPLMAAIAKGGDASYIPIVGYRYNIDGESASNNLSHEKEYRFYARVLSCVRRLAGFYGIQPRKLRAHFNDKISHIASQIRRSENRRELLADFDARRGEWPLRLPLRAIAHRLLAFIYIHSK